jgi:hypothetical protein
VLVLFFYSCLPAQLIIFHKHLDRFYAVGDPEGLDISLLGEDVFNLRSYLVLVLVSVAGGMTPLPTWTGLGRRILLFAWLRP